MTKIDPKTIIHQENAKQFITDYWTTRAVQFKKLRQEELRSEKMQQWHARVGECAQNPATLKQVIAQLSPADQKAFLAEVNTAISQMPGSPEAQSARFLAANRAAVSGVAPAERLGVLSEVFATVPAEHLPEITERFSLELFNRNADTTRTFTDAEYEKISKDALTAISERCESAENGGVRSTFAAMMFVKASGGGEGVESLKESLVEALPESVQAAAKNEWIPAATAETPNYDAILGAAQAGEQPDHAVVTQVSPIQTRNSLIGELVDVAANEKETSSASTATATASTDSSQGDNQDQLVADIGILQTPKVIYDRYIPPNTAENPGSKPKENPVYYYEPKDYPYESNDSSATAG